MEKIKLNNQIVSMRKYIKQAKVHVINKLVKQIKFLQNRKGSETQIEKARRKAERFLEAVALVKKIKPDDVSKLALSKAKDWKAVLQQKNATLHDRCIAMLANYGAVQKEVEVFYNANKELVLKISDYVTQWEEKNKLSNDSCKINKVSSPKKSHKNIQRANLKDESSSNNKKNKFNTVPKTETEANTEKNYAAFKMSYEDEKIHLAIDNSDNRVDNEEKVAIVNKSNINKSPIRNTVKSEYLHSENNSMEAEESIKHDDETESDDENDEEKETTLNFVSNNKKEAKDSSGEESGEVGEIRKSLSKSDTEFNMYNHTKDKLKAIALLNLNELEGLDEIPVNSSIGNDECDEKESSDDEINETFQNKSSDPFFLGHQREDSDTKEINDSSNKSDVNFAHSFNPRTETVKSSFFHRKDNHFSPKKFFQKSPYNHGNASKNFNNEKNNGNAFQRNKFTSKNYHNKFQEKKMDKKDFKLKYKPHPPMDTYGKKQFKNTSNYYGNDDNIPLKSKMPYKKGNRSETLHPSWEAKRKQKILLNASFQGKKVIYD